MAGSDRPQLDTMVAEATVDCYNDDECVTGFYTAIADHLALPFQTRVLGVDVTVDDVDLSGSGQIMAICARDGWREPIPILDLPMPAAAPADAEWIEAYRHWLRSEDMSKNSGTLPAQLQAWLDARKRHKLSHSHVQMARELGLNHKKLGKVDNHRQEPWKAPLPQFIEHLYVKGFNRERPEVVVPIEQRARQAQQQQAARKPGRDPVMNCDADRGTETDVACSAFGQGRSQHPGEGVVIVVDLSGGLTSVRPQRAASVANYSSFPQG